MTTTKPEQVFEDAKRIANYIRWQLREVVALIMSIGSFGWGATVIAFPEGMTGLAGCGLRETIEWASPQMWGALLVAASSVLAPAMLLVPRMAAFPAALLSLVYAALSASMIVNTFHAAPVPTGAWAYATLSCVAASLAWASVAERRE